MVAWGHACGAWACSDGQLPACGAMRCLPSAPRVPRPATGSGWGAGRR